MLDREPTGNCPIHPNEPHVWSGHDWFCQSCFFGFAPESLYGHILEAVKAAQGVDAYNADKGSMADERAIEATRKIMEIIQDKAAQTVAEADHGKVVVLLRGKPSFNGTPSEAKEWLEKWGDNVGFEVHIPWLNMTLPARRFVELARIGTGGK